MNDFEDVKNAVQDNGTRDQDMTRWKVRTKAAFIFLRRCGYQTVSMLCGRCQSCLSRVTCGYSSSLEQIRVFCFKSAGAERRGSWNVFVNCVICALSRIFVVLHLDVHHLLSGSEVHVLRELKT